MPVWSDMAGCAVLGTRHKIPQTPIAGLPVRGIRHPAAWQQKAPAARAMHIEAVARDPGAPYSTCAISTGTQECT